MNQGLRSYAKLLKQQVGSAGQVFVNVYPTDANLHMVIPIYKTAGLRPIDLSIVFSYQDRATLGEFGYGARSNYYKHFSLSQDEQIVTVTNADGSSNEYVRVSSTGSEATFECKEIYTTLIRKWYCEAIVPKYTLIDKYGNKLFYYTSNALCSIESKNGDVYTCPDYSGLTSISNNKGDRAAFTYNGNGTIDRLTFYKNESTIYRYVDFNYINGFLISVVHKKANEAVIFGNTYSLYGASSIFIFDELTQYRIRYLLTDGRVTSLKDGYDNDLTGGLETTIEYNSDHTRVTDYQGNYVKYYFDENRFPLYDIDYKCRVITYNYQRNSITNAVQLLAQSNPFDNNPTISQVHSLVTNGYFDNNLSGWTSTGFGGTTSVVQDTTNPFYDILGGNVLLIQTHPVYGRMVRQTINVNGLPGDDLTLSLWSKEINPSEPYEYSALARIIVKKGATEVGRVDIPIRNSFGYTLQWNLFAGGFKAEAAYDGIYVEILVENDKTFHFDGVILRKAPLGAMFTYSEDGNLTSSIVNKASSNYDYTKGENVINNLLQQSYNPDSSLFNMQYDAHGNMTKARAAYDVYQDNTYDDNNNLTKSVISYDDEKFETETSYSQSGSFPVNQTNELGFITAMNFEETYGRLLSITDPNLTSNTYTYNDFDNLLTLVTSKDSSSAAASYTYDSRQRIETITTPNNVVYKFFYDDQNKLLNVKVGRTSLTATNQLFAYEYENQNQPSLPQTGIIKKTTLGSDGDSYQFVYNDDNQLTSIQFKEASADSYTTIFTYTYDGSGRLTRYDDNRTNRYLTYVYNVMNQITGVTDQDDNEFDYEYDTLGNVRTRKATLAERVEQTGYSPQYRGKGMNPEAVYRTFQTENYAGFFNEFNTDNSRNLDLLHINEDGSIDIIEHEASYTLEDLWAIDSFIPQILYKVYTTDHLAYKVNCISSVDSLPKGSISFWFNPTVFNGETNLLWTFKVGAIENSIRLYFSSQTQLCLTLARANDEGDDVLVITETIAIPTLQLNKWHFISLTWNNIFNGTSGLYDSTYTINFDGGTYEFDYEGERYVEFANLNWLHIGCRPLDPDPSTRKLIGSVTSVMVSQGIFLLENMRFNAIIV